MANGDQEYKYTDVEVIRKSNAALRIEVDRLKAAIREHRDQKADDRCWMDDEKLYEVLGEPIPYDRRVGDKLAMIANCARFLDQRCESGGWKSYRDLEWKISELEYKLQQARMREATAWWREETGQHDVLPDLGKLLEWLMEKAKEKGKPNGETL